MNINFLYWNIHNLKGKKTLTALSQLVQDHNIDILTVSELSLKKELIPGYIDAITKGTGLTYFNASLKNNHDNWLFIFYRRQENLSLSRIEYDYHLQWDELVDNPSIKEDQYFFKYQSRNERMLFIKLEYQTFSTLLVPIHFPSRLYATPQKQWAIAENYRKHIQLRQAKEALNSKIIFGDFNMLPFEKGMVDYKAFHAVPDRLLLNQKIKYLGEPYEALYNPVWSLMGDFSSLRNSDTSTTVIQELPSASYFNQNGTGIDYYWYFFDQVLLSKEIIQYFDYSEFELLQKTSRQSLVDNLHRPNSVDYSDHLPVKFKLKK